MCITRDDDQLASKFPFKLAAIDLDGTLLGPDKTISEQNAAAVRMLSQNAVKVIIASGRRHQNIVRFQRQLQLDGPIIACQGGLIRDGESGNVIEAHFLAQNAAREIVNDSEKNGVQAIYYHLDHLYVAERNNRWLDLYVVASRRKGRNASRPKPARWSSRIKDRLVRRTCRTPEDSAGGIRPVSGKSRCAIDRIRKPGIHDAGNQQSHGSGKSCRAAWRTPRAGFDVR